jgi:hypothetical protein
LFCATFIVQAIEFVLTFFDFLAMLRLLVAIASKKAQGCDFQSQPLASLIFSKVVIAFKQKVLIATLRIAVNIYRNIYKIKFIKFASSFFFL